MLNKVILVGNLGAVPQVHQSQSGTTVVTFNVATSESWKGTDGQCFASDGNGKIISSS